MPEIGRPAAEAGNDYHDIATVHRVLDMLTTSEVVEVWPESFDAVDDIRVQFVSGVVEYCQVKEESPGASWTAASLCNERVLPSFLEQLRRQPASKLTFNTGGTAREFRAVAERARDARQNHDDQTQAIAEWESRLKGHVSFLKTAEKRLDVDRAESIRLFAAITVEESQGTLEQGRARATERLRVLVEDPAAALSELAGLARESAKHRLRITPTGVRVTLEKASVALISANWAPQLDLAGYANRLAIEADRFDTAQLPPLDSRIRYDDGLEQVLDPAVLPPRGVLVGTHGSGKSRVAAQISRNWLAAGRSGLHLRLGRWATDLSGLLSAELGRALGRATSQGDLRAFLVRQDAFLVLDGLDEVPRGEQVAAASEIVELAGQVPGLQLVLTSRPGSVRISEDWAVLHLLDLTDEQVTSVLGTDNWRWNWPGSIRSLVHNPLMLGLVRPAVAESGYLPQSEVELLSTFVESIAAREAARQAVDSVTGLRALEEVAYEWLENRTLGVSPTELRSIAARASLRLREAELSDISGPRVEAYVTGVGLAVALPDGVVLPRHRSLLDHLAGRALERRDPVGAVGRPQLREAIAHFTAMQSQTGIRLVAVFDATASKDIELLARCRSLRNKDVTWTGSPEEYAETYVRALRSLQHDQLSGLPLAPPRVEVRIDRAMSWVNETASNRPDSVVIVDGPERASIGIGGNLVPVQSISGHGFAGREITSGVPHFTAYDRISDALSHAIDKRLFPDEGPDGVYERLVDARDIADRLFNSIKGGPPAGLSSDDLTLITPRALVDHLKEFVSIISRDRPLDFMQCLFTLVPPGVIGILGDAVPAQEDPRDPKGNRSGLTLHCAGVYRLLEEAKRYGIADAPLHFLGLRPQAAADPILKWPRFLTQLHGVDLALFVKRHEEAALRTYRHLVEANIPGLAQSLATYRSLPLRVDATVVERPAMAGDWRSSVYYTTEQIYDSEDVVTADVADRPPPRHEMSRWAVITTLQSARNSAYEMLDRDAASLLGGRYALGSASL